MTPREVTPSAVTGPEATGPATPYLLLDRARLEANIAGAARAAVAAGVQLRPHVKTHKSARIARMQLEAGAVGITVATVGEAEVFAAHGCRDIFVAYPVWLDRARAARVAGLVADGVRISLGVDSVAGAAQAAAALGADRSRVPVRVELDSGQHRSGAEPDAAGAVARAAADAGMPVEGVFTFPGHSYGPGAGDPAAADETTALARGAASLEAAGVPAPVRSGGSTPSLAASLATRPSAGGPTELRPGVYALGDAQQWELGAMAPHDAALSCVATVVSDTGAGRVVLDAGSKVLGADRAAWATGFGRLPDHAEARVVQLSEHHAVVEARSGPAGPPLGPLGARVRVLPNHVCAAVNLADLLHVDERGAEPPWPVDARGRNA